MSRPFFETKVVKVKKEKKLYINPRGAGKSFKYWKNFSDMTLERIQINARRELERRKTVEPKPKGNWVNGENLDAIKFPCFCSYKNNQIRFLGEINSSFRIGHGQEYILSYVEGQGDTSIVEQNKSLKNLIEVHDIHILRGKIIIFEEE